MSINSFYYKEFVDCVIKIFKTYNKENYISDLNLNKDLSLLSSVFLEPLNIIKEHYLSWNDTLWIESTKYIKLGLLSFLYKNKASLYKIYTLVENNNIYKCILLEKYKNLFKDLMANKNLVAIQNYIVQEVIELDEIEKKKYYLILNIKNFKNPKFMAYLFDIMTYKTFRKNIFKYILDNIKKIDIDDITTIENEYENIIVNDFDNLIENGFFYSLSNFIMFLNFGKNKQICVNNVIYTKVKDYIKDVLEKSSKLYTYIDLLVTNNKDSDTIFKSDTSLVIIAEDVTSKPDLDYYINNKTSKFEETYKNSNSIVLEEIDFDNAYDKAFIKKKTIKFNQRDFITRISHLIYIIIEYITLLPKKDSKSKLNKLNLLIQNILTAFFKQDTESDDLISDITENGIFTDNQTSLSKEETKTELINFINNIIKELLKNNTDTAEEDIEYLKKIFQETINKLHIYNNLSNLENFNLFSEFFQTIINNKNLFKIFLMEILQEKHILKMIDIIEKTSVFKINILCKKKIIELILNFIQQIITFINIKNDQEYINNVKVLLFIGQLCDKVYIFVHNFSKNSKDTHNVKRIVKYNTIKK